ncbi:hypothetical protein PFISCL1PPCAC_29150, partial [Pristionchus fissidentatus]
ALQLQDAHGHAVAGEALVLDWNIVQVNFEELRLPERINPSGGPRIHRVQAFESSRWLAPRETTPDTKPCSTMCLAWFRLVASAVRTSTTGVDEKRPADSSCGAGEGAYGAYARIANRARRRVWLPWLCDAAPIFFRRSHSCECRLDLYLHKCLIKQSDNSLLERYLHRLTV